jgi:hypothetical protein
VGGRRSRLLGQLGPRHGLSAGDQGRVVGPALGGAVDPGLHMPIL